MLYKRYRRNFQTIKQVRTELSSEAKQEIDNELNWLKRLQTQMTIRHIKDMIPYKTIRIAVSNIEELFEKAILKRESLLRLIISPRFSNNLHKMV